MDGKEGSFPAQKQGAQGPCLRQSVKFSMSRKKNQNALSTIFLLTHIFLVYQIQLRTWKCSSERGFPWIKEKGRKGTLALLGHPRPKRFVFPDGQNPDNHAVITSLCGSGETFVLISLLRRAEVYQALLWGRCSSVCPLALPTSRLGMTFFPGEGPSVSYLLSSNFENIHIVGGISLINQILLTSQHLLGTLRNKVLPAYRWQLREQP